MKYYIKIKLQYEIEQIKERGSAERHNALLRRCIPKGMPIKAFSEETIKQILQ